MYKKILSGLLALSMVVPAFANVTSAGGTGSVPVELNAAATNFSVTVPTGLPVDVAADGTITVCQENYIINNSFGPVEVKGAKIETANGWTLKDFTSRFETLKVNAQEFGFQLNECNVNTNGTVAVTNFQPIDGKASQNFIYNAKVAPQAEQLGKQQIASVVFTLGWSDGGMTPTDKPHATGSPVDAATMYDALSNLSGTIRFSREPAPESATLPLNSDETVLADIHGRDATVYSRDGGGVFAPVDSTGLFTPEPKTNSWWSQPYQASVLDVSGLDTSKVTNMTGMFIYYSAGTTLDLSSFDTSNVTSMSCMFQHCGVKTLDLSSFDTSNVTNMSCMFDDSAARTIYCRTTEDRQKMQGSSSCTATGFIVGKPQ